MVATLCKLNAEHALSLLSNPDELSGYALSIIKHFVINLVLVLSAEY